MYREQLGDDFVPMKELKYKLLKTHLLHPWGVAVCTADPISISTFNAEEATCANCLRIYKAGLRRRQRQSRP